ncbi:hypothetical protein ACFOYU_11445 [Microvirga sp. GCM10011540]|uniref:hypothetical protein n=1 Tax=Microvirga sp. GCM10011540 TaxID=3317338 RepID=UPI0036199F2B
METPLDHLAERVGCICFPGDAMCACPDHEQVLRAYAYVEEPSLPPMNMDQRAWCIAQIESVEGHSADGHEPPTDRDLASRVLEAWADFARDKGLL